MNIPTLTEALKELDEIETNETPHNREQLSGAYEVSDTNNYTTYGAECQEFQEIIPFDAPELPPPLSADFLPVVFADMAKAAAASVQVDVSLTVGAVLGALSTASTGRWSVRISQDWTIPASLYVGLVAVSGEGKSPAMSTVFAPVRVYESEKRAADEVSIAEETFLAELLEDDIKRLKRDYGTCETAKKAAIACEIKSKQAELKEAQPKKPSRLTTSDSTLEKIAALQSENGGVIAVVSDEGVLIDTAAGLYSGGNTANLDVLLKSHSGTTFTVDRQGKDKPTIVEKPRLTICVGLQPFQCEKLLSNVTLRERGLPARFLFVHGSPKQGSRVSVPTPISQSIRERYAEAIDAVLAKNPLSDGVISLSDEAVKEWREFFEEVEKDIREGGMLSFSPAWTAKFKENVARIACLLHVAETEIPESEPLNGECMQRSIALGWELSLHAGYIYNTASSADENEENAKYLLKRIKHTGKLELSRSELTMMCRKLKADDIESAVNLLEEHAYILRGTVYKERGQKGGNAKEIIRVNPAFYNV
ncbi:hypothetical protein FACS1894219_10680 [Clostridia bacterium]|nr:hypothetical protein FACS1894219_10680 [Clostridia bacterium]